MWSAGEVVWSAGDLVWSVGCWCGVWGAGVECGVLVRWCGGVMCMNAGCCDGIVSVM